MRSHDPPVTETLEGADHLQSFSARSFHPVFYPSLPYTDPLHDHVANNTPCFINLKPALPPSLLRLKRKQPSLLPGESPQLALAVHPSPPLTLNNSFPSSPAINLTPLLQRHPFSPISPNLSQPQTPPVSWFPPASPSTSQDPPSLSVVPLSPGLDEFPLVRGITHDDWSLNVCHDCFGIVQWSEVSRRWECGNCGRTVQVDKAQPVEVRRGKLKAYTSTQASSLHLSIGGVAGVTAIGRSWVGERDNDVVGEPAPGGKKSPNVGSKETENAEVASTEYFFPSRKKRRVSARHGPTLQRESAYTEIRQPTDLSDLDDIPMLGHEVVNGIVPTEPSHLVHGDMVGANNLIKIPTKLPRDLSTYINRDGEYPVATGGYADIYKGTFHDRKYGKETKVAIKAIRVYSIEDNYSKKIKRLRREIKVWLKLNHANIVPLLGTTSLGFNPFPAMVCPWIENGTLTAYLEHRGSGFELLRVLALIHDVASGLNYLHSQSIVHGDLSGSNVLVDANNKACITDFGLSTLLDEVGGSTPATTSTGKLRGTLRWAAPELLDPLDQENTKPHPGPTMKSDIYSFGGIMLQILCGKVPYHEYSRDMQIVAAISRGETPKRPHDLRITDHRWDFIQRCWSPFKMVVERPSSEEVLTFSKNDFFEHWL